VAAALAHDGHGVRPERAAHMEGACQGMMRVIVRSTAGNLLRRGAGDEDALSESLTRVVTCTLFHVEFQLSCTTGPELDGPILMTAAMKEP
jgi:hypothetical protein